MFGYERVNFFGMGLLVPEFPFMQQGQQLPYYIQKEVDNILKIIDEYESPVAASAFGYRY